MDIGRRPDLVDTGVCLFQFLLLMFVFLVTCAID